VEHAVCALDSALQLKLISRSQARWLLATPKGRRIYDLSDGRSQSGLETLARLRLRSLGLRVRVQVKISDIGRVDLLIGDRLVIELDGDQWHSTPEQREEDRRRDSAMVALGYLVLRAGYWRVLDDWGGFEREVLAVVRRKDHLWHGRLRRPVHGVGETEQQRPQA
jgi:very-short-patch-repair endonuclease